MSAGLDILGDKWSIEVINCALMGVHRFGAFRALLGIAQDILSGRVTRRMGADFLNRGDNRHGGRPALGDWLTKEGLFVPSVLLRFQDGADAWITERCRSPATLMPRPCARLVQLAQR